MYPKALSWRQLAQGENIALWAVSFPDQGVVLLLSVFRSLRVSAAAGICLMDQTHRHPLHECSFVSHPLLLVIYMPSDLFTANKYCYVLFNIINENETD